MADESQHFRHMHRGDPDFPRHGLAFAHQLLFEMHVVVTDTRQTIETSKTLMANVDRLLARK